MTRCGALILVLAVAAPLQAQTPEPAPPSSAFYEFMMARRLESSGDTAGALAALQRAQKLDPASAELHAELAGYYARQNKAADAVTEANLALKLDAQNVEAHHILAMVYSAWAEGAVPPPAGQTSAALRNTAVEHLLAIQASPLMATDPNLQMTLGRLQLRSGKAKDAVPTLERVAAQVPWAAEPLALLAEARTAIGRIDEAAQALAAAAEINPRYWASLGDLYERQGKWPDAAGAYSEAVDGIKNPSRDLRIKLANALLNVNGGASKAKDVLAELLKATPDDTRLLYLMSNAQRASGDLAAAEATARRITTIDPSNITGLYALSLTLFDRYEYRQAVEALTPFEKESAARAKGRETEGAMVLVQLGIAHQQLGEFDAAITSFNGARVLTPKDPELDAYLVQAYLAARRFDRAETLARESLLRTPDQPRLVRLRAQALAKSGKNAEANKLLEDAVAARPDSRDYLVGLSDLYADQKRTDDAVKLLEQARKTFGDDETLTLRMATAYELGGRLGDAEKEFRRLLSDDPLNANAMNSLSYMLADRSLRLPEAVDLAQRAVKIDPENPAYLDTLGWALFKSGKADEADAPLARAAGALRGSSVIQVHHGDVLAGRGKTAEAIAAWERALAGDGESIDRAAIEKKIKDARARKK
ncbi:MAG: tetratricopeptide repeat protein [Vicinamibacterales bacterium]